LVGRVKQVRTVLVHLYAGLGLRLGVRVAADVWTPLDDKDPLIELGGHPFGDRQAEKSGTDDQEVEASCHRQLGYPSFVSPGRNAPTPGTASKVAIASRFRLATLVHISHASTIGHVGIGGYGARPRPAGADA